MSWEIRRYNEYRKQWIGVTVDSYNWTYAKVIGQRKHPTHLKIWEATEMMLVNEPESVIVVRVR